MLAAAAILGLIDVGLWLFCLGLACENRTLMKLLRHSTAGG